ncbi:hypothetical protein PFISCL1PPCAC_9073, partial [Pristionchus fissidentatus]
SRAIMSVAIITGPPPAPPILFQIQLNHSEESVREFVGSQGFDGVSRICTVIGNREFPVVGHAVGMNYRVYLNCIDTSSPSPSISSASSLLSPPMDWSSPPPPTYAQLTNVQSERMIEPPEHYAVHAAERDEEQMRDSQYQIDRKLANIKKDVKCNIKVHQKATSIEETPPVVTNKFYALAHFDSSQVSKAILDMDILSLMKASEKSNQVIEFCLNDGDLMNDRLWRPRLVQVIGKQTMIHGIRPNYPNRDEWMCLIRSLQQGGLSLDPNRMCHY